MSMRFRSAGEKPWQRKSSRKSHASGISDRPFDIHMRRSSENGDCGNLSHTLRPPPNTATMAAVYKSMSKHKSSKSTDDGDNKPTLKQQRQRILMLTSRGVTARNRHLLADLNALLPHSRKDAKLDTKTQLQQLNELADL